MSYGLLASVDLATLTVPKIWQLGTRPFELIRQHYPNQVCRKSWLDRFFSFIQCARPRQGAPLYRQSLRFVGSSQGYLERQLVYLERIGYRGDFARNMTVVLCLEEVAR